MVSNLGSSDIDARLEELLIDGILYAFQEQVCVLLELSMRRPHQRFATAGGVCMRSHCFTVASGGRGARAGLRALWLCVGLLFAGAGAALRAVKRGWGCAS